MDAWTILYNELKHYGVKLIDRGRCETYVDGGRIDTQGILRLMRNIKSDIKHHKKTLLFLFQDIEQLLQSSVLGENEICDERMSNLFVFSLKDLSKFLTCFEEIRESIFSNIITAALNRDIKSFSKNQIYRLPDYKISIDYIHRTISKLMYVSDLLYAAALGKKYINKHPIKLAKGISGPWSNLDLPMEERVFDFGDEHMGGRVKDRQHQRRYRKHLENYNNDGRVGEGHYWREIRNEPFSWADRADEDPYPHRSILNN